MDELFAVVGGFLDDLSDELPEQFVDVMVDSIDMVVDAAGLFSEQRNNDDKENEEG